MAGCRRLNELNSREEVLADELQKKNSELTNRKRLLLLMGILKKYTDDDHQLNIQKYFDFFEEDYGLEVNTVGAKNDLRELEKINSFPVIRYHLY